MWHVHLVRSRWGGEQRKRKPRYCAAETMFHEIDLRSNEAPPVKAAPRAISYRLRREWGSPAPGSWWPAPMCLQHSLQQSPIMLSCRSCCMSDIETFCAGIGAGWAAATAAAMNIIMFNSPEFEIYEKTSKFQERFGGGVAVSGWRPWRICVSSGMIRAQTPSESWGSARSRAGRAAEQAMVQSANGPLALFEPWSGQCCIGIAELCRATEPAAEDCIAKGIKSTATSASSLKSVATQSQ
jgi:hypothetical protein